MNNLSSKTTSKKQTKKNDSSTVKITKETKRELSKLLAKVNKKDFGRRVRAEKLLLLALQQIDDSHIKKLQEGSLSNEDKLEMKYREYIRNNGNISKDAFIGKLLAGESVLGGGNHSNS
jgi:hypothetical protein